MNTKHPRKRSRKRKCKHCGQLYMPDARHLRDQQYCGAPSCRIASKRASHRRWLSSPKGAEYRDPVENKRRVCQWRKANPGYWRRGGRKGADALQDTMDSQSSFHQDVTAVLATDALQDSFLSQPALVVGVIAHLTGCALQDTIVSAMRRFVLLGQDILGTVPGSPPKGDNRYGHAKAHYQSRASPAHSRVVQLG
jgi:hypothetical protein